MMNTEAALLWLFKKKTVKKTIQNSFFLLLFTPCLALMPICKVAIVNLSQPVADPVSVVLALEKGGR